MGGGSRNPEKDKQVTEESGNCVTRHVVEGLVVLGWERKDQAEANWCCTKARVMKEMDV